MTFHDATLIFLALSMIVAAFVVNLASRDLIEYIKVLRSMITEARNLGLSVPVEPPVKSQRRQSGKSTIDNSAES